MKTEMVNSYYDHCSHRITHMCLYMTGRSEGPVKLYTPFLLLSLSTSDLQIGHFLSYSAAAVWLHSPIFICLADFNCSNINFPIINASSFNPPSTQMGVSQNLFSFITCTLSSLPISSFAQMLDFSTLSLWLPIHTPRFTSLYPSSLNSLSNFPRWKVALTLLYYRPFNLTLLYVCVC